jgi:hypothetical protein
LLFQENSEDFDGRVEIEPLRTIPALQSSDAGARLYEFVLVSRKHGAALRGELLIGSTYAIVSAHVEFPEDLLV